MIDARILDLVGRSGYLFMSRRGSDLHCSQFFPIVPCCARTADLPPEKCHLHTLTHSLPIHLIAGNMNLALVKQCLEDKTISSTVPCVADSDSQAVMGS